MGVSIEYTLVGGVPNSTVESLNTQIDELSSDYDWYIEPIYLFESNGQVTGASKLFLLSDEEGNELEPAEESPKVMHDLDKLISTLTKLSSNHNMTWELAIEGVPVGKISIEGPDESLSQTLTEFLTVFGDESLITTESSTLETTEKKPWWKFW